MYSPVCPTDSPPPRGQPDLLHLSTPPIITPASNSSKSAEFINIEARAQIEARLASTHRHLGMC